MEDSRSNGLTLSLYEVVMKHYVIYLVQLLLWVMMKTFENTTLDLYTAQKLPPGVLCPT